MKNDVWEVVPRPTGKSVVTSKWLYKIKHVADGSVEKYKARFVAYGFTQKKGIDYDETFALVSGYTTIRTIISLVAVFRWKLHQINVKTAFLNGLKHATRVWYARMDGFLHSLGFSKSTTNSNLYFKVVHILVIYIDDLFLTGGEHLIE